jgi:N-methylhydantoinase B
VRRLRRRGRADPVALELARHLFASVAEEMGSVLRRAAFSPNIKERRDYSCGVFDRRGRAVAMGDHMPVHLGSMPATLERVLARHPPGPGEMVLLNDPFAGGTHLPDLTLVAPYPAGSAAPRFYLANRAHHSDVGGMAPGSMPAGAVEIYQEGLVLPPVRLVRQGRTQPDVLALILANVRTPREREADLLAQVAANRAGAARLAGIERRAGIPALRRWGEDQIAYANRVVRAFLREIPDGSYRAGERLEGDGVTRGAIRLQVEIRVRAGRVVVDFDGTDPEQSGNLNAVESITRSAVCYAFRCLVREEIPYNAGCFAPISVRIPPGTVLSARHPRAVAGGNVETSQRVVDLVFRALEQALPERIPAQSCGTMTNLTLGGIDPRTGAGFTYYETTGGGMGASHSGDGLSGVHTHMTNSRNTPVEALEQAYPLEVAEYSLRRGSGGAGRHRGGEGILREIRALGTARASLLAERHRIPPGGAAGGGAGRPGRAWRRSGGRLVRIPSKTTQLLRPGESIRLATPGGGGWGRARASTRPRPSGADR